MKFIGGSRRSAPEAFLGVEAVMFRFLRKLFDRVVFGLDSDWDPVRDFDAIPPVEVESVAVGPVAEPRLVCEMEGHTTRSEEVMTKLKEKTERRARRHFAGKNVKHRVVKKDENSIEFAFFRRSSSPTRLRWQKLDT